jgi:hypothetical protein
MAKRRIKIGNAGGYWGDDLGALKRQIEGGKLDFVGIDFLAEITMSILQKQRTRNPELGYAADFVNQMREVWPAASTKGTRVLCNAGGVNPVGLGKALVKLAKELKIGAKVGVVTGDDIMHRLDELAKHLDNMETGESFGGIRDRVSAANVYFGAAPLVAALDHGADVVVTGRCTDTALTMAPLIHSFGWAEDDWDKLASSVVGGHILECGAQATGGNFTDWRDVKSFKNFGYPVLIGEKDGSFTITKHGRTGGLVNSGTVREQLVYEMGDPGTYITPDVVADFRTIDLSDSGSNKVKVTGLQGRPPPDNLKVSIAYRDGWKASGSIIICGPNALEKARVFSEIFFARLEHKYEGQLVEFVGHNACHRSMAPKTEPNEVLLRLAVRDSDKAKVRDFGMLLPSIILSGPPGVAITGGRPKPQEILAYWPALVPRELIEMKVEVFGTGRGKPKVARVRVPPAAPPQAPPRLARPELPVLKAGGAKKKASLSQIAFGRSGDKGDTCNVGIVARSDLAYTWLRSYLTPARLKKWFGDLVLGPITRHEVACIRSLNFLCEQALDGGGTRSLRLDAQGKTFAPAVLGREVEIPTKVLRSCK